MVMMCPNMFFLQMGKVLENMKKINPLREHIKLDKKKSEAFSELLSV